MKPTIMQVLSNVFPMTLNPDWDGSCPCAELAGKGFEVKTDCWRTGSHPKGCAVHVTGKLSSEDKLKVATHVAKNSGWRRHDWHIYIDGRHHGCIEGEE
jgi:hypothetical protein